jgi:hypothetical protein
MASEEKFRQVFGSYLCPPPPIVAGTRPLTVSRDRYFSPNDVVTHLKAGFSTSLVCPSRFLTLRGWKDDLVIVSPATVVGWHRQGFRLWRRWKSRGGDGRPRIDAEVRRLIRRMARDNPLWGARNEMAA